MPISTFFMPTTMYNLARGPFVWASLIICASGCLIRIIRVISLTEKWKPDRNIPELKVKNRMSVKKSYFRIKFTILGAHPVTISVSTVFHVLIFVCPLTLIAHNILFRRATGIGFFCFPEKISNIFAFVVLGCVAFFLIRRLFIKRIRVISDIYDYLILFVIMMPFLTGILSFYQIYDYRTMVILHMLSGEFMLIAIPFTRIFHMFFFFIGRFLLVGQHNFGRGIRTW